MILTDPVNLLCDLIEARVGSFEANALGREAGEAVEFLSKIGAFMPGQLTRVLTCRACQNVHPVHLEFDPKTRRHWHFCPEAGRVMVEDDVLATVRVDPEWVLDWLVTVLPITPPVRRRLLVPTLAWHLGDAHIGGTELAVVFAIGICSQPNLSALATALSVAPPVDFGVVLTTSAAPPRPLRLPHRYEFLELREIARPGKDCLAIEKTKLVGWIKGLRKGLDKPARLRAGRPTDATLVHEIFQERRDQALPLVNQRTEAEKIRAEIALRHPERDPPAGKTIECHLSRIRNGLRGAVRQAAEGAGGRER
jgi:hypothetical protein